MLLDFSTYLFLTLFCDVGGNMVHKPDVTTLWAYVTQAHKKNFFSEPWIPVLFFPAETESATRWTPTRQDFDITSKNTKKFTGSNKIIYFMLLSTPFLRNSNFLAP